MHFINTVFCYCCLTTTGEFPTIIGVAVAVRGCIKVVAGLTISVLIFAAFRTVAEVKPPVA